jgi:phosphatidylserine/phosphatidylglycerophosphate/cardiolipin synthase-like enzyme
VSIDDRWLDHANPADLQSLAWALLDGRLAAPYTTSGAQLAGAGPEAAAFLESLRGADPSVIAWMLERLAQERRRAADRHASVAHLVWSGASEGEASIRDTRVVLDSLFSRAEWRVVVSTYVIHRGRAVFSALTQRLREQPGIEVEIYVNLPSNSGRDEDEKADVDAYLETFGREHWPEDLPLPALYYDPESRKLGPSRTSLHAKCVVVDERWALVTSANFTEAAQERNIEAGVLLDHPKLAEALAARFKALRESAMLRRMGTR